MRGSTLRRGGAARAEPISSPPVRLLDDDVPDGAAAGNHREHVFLVRTNHVEQVRPVVFEHLCQRGRKLRLAADLGRLQAEAFRDLDEVGIRLVRMGAVPLADGLRIVDRA